MNSRKGPFNIGTVSFSLDLPEDLSTKEFDELKQRLEENIEGIAVIGDPHETDKVEVLEGALARIRDIRRAVMHETFKFLNSLPSPTR